LYAASPCTIILCMVILSASGAVHETPPEHFASLSLP
jgi:hypothetical protein